MLPAPWQPKDTPFVFPLPHCSLPSSLLTSLFLTSLSHSFSLREWWRETTRMWECERPLPFCPPSLGSSSQILLPQWIRQALYDFDLSCCAIVNSVPMVPKRFSRTVHYALGGNLKECTFIFLWTWASLAAPSLVSTDTMTADARPRLWV